MAKYPEQPFDRGDRSGYPPGIEGVTMPRVKYRAKDAPEDSEAFANAHGANAYLIDQTQKGQPSIPLWISEITADFALSGNTAQSMLKRDFYAHNFQQPSFTFHGQTFNEAQYGRLTEFIRRTQIRQVLERGGAAGGDWEHRGFLRIVIPRAGFIPRRVRIRRKGKPNARVITRRINRSQRGERDHMDIVGYVKSIARTHERFVNAPEWDFEFITARMLAGPFSDAPIRSQKLRNVKDWTEFLRGQEFVPDPDSKDDDSKWRPPSWWGDDNDTDLDFADDQFEEVADIIGDAFKFPR